MGCAPSVPQQNQDDACQRTSPPPAAPAPAPLPTLVEIVFNTENNDPVEIDDDSNTESPAVSQGASKSESTTLSFKSFGSASLANMTGGETAALEEDTNPIGCYFLKHRLAAQDERQANLPALPQLIISEDSP